MVDPLEHLGQFADLAAQLLIAGVRHEDGDDGTDVLGQVAVGGPGLLQVFQVERLLVLEFLDQPLELGVDPFGAGLFDGLLEGGGLFLVLGAAALAEALGQAEQGGLEIAELPGQLLLPDGGLLPGHLGVDGVTVLGGLGLGVGLGRVVRPGSEGEADRHHQEGSQQATGHGQFLP